MSLRVRMTAEPCDACPWKGRLPGGLRAGRLKELREQTLRKQGVFVCHKAMVEHRSTATFGEGDGAAVCSGWAESLPGDWPSELQIADRLGFIVRTDAHGRRLEGEQE